MNHRALIATLTLVGALTPVAHADASDLADALASRFAACMTEAGLEASDDLADALEPLAESWGTRLGVADCAGPACIDALAGVSCDDLAAAGDDAMAPEPAPPWAVAVGDALVDRIGACFEVEAGRPPTDAERLSLELWRDDTASAFAAAARLAGGTVDPAAAEPCAAAIAGLECGALAGGLDPAGGAALEGLAEGCADLFGVPDRLDGIDELYEAEVGQGMADD